MTAPSHAEVTLLDLRSIGLTKGPTHWRTVRVQRTTTNDNERQRTSADRQWGVYPFAGRSSTQRELIGSPPVPATDYWHPLTFAVGRCRSLHYSPAPSPGWLI